MKDCSPNIDFFGLPADAHRCIGEIIGDWIVFKCPICEGYERRVNWKTGETRATGKTDFLHYGSPNNKNNASALLALSGDN